MYDRKINNLMVLEKGLGVLIESYIAANVFADISSFEEDIEGLIGLPVIIAGVIKMSIDNAVSLMCIKDQSKKEVYISEEEMRLIVKNSADIICDTINTAEANTSAFDDNTETDYAFVEEDIYTEEEDE